ncbi:TRAP dicarboxylate transporter subunit DctP [Nitratireductor aquibiodomus RA22]|uniref:Tripartite ATP-independent transporter solute receptor, DctP family n=2 Tax=Nitratireductor aquibiodomus TaxID=204799 RepID=A0A1H4L5N5_9HYPH|nr:sialic acid TRAP transporter substrate-binding protein SiaP [Nitratireductor aquibiodomus]EIM72447.1 TRAP dicarboxylate transporter subunit DctP [Nitratireductor aquibiodomus RA22]SEB66067.1 tripartite ATP-independent transporter solute receptor, DctP family [Nitratireductor aquibiodomus]
MLKLSRLRALSIGAAVAIAASATATLAQDVLKFGHVYEASTPYHAAALRAAELLEEATGGRYKMEVFPASQLGKEAALNEALSLGTVDVIYTGVAFLGQSYGPISISDYPFTMRSYEHWKAYVNSDLFDEMSEAYNKVSGNTVAAMTYYGARHVTANKPILSPKDMEGLKIRTPNAPAYQMFPRATGANPTPMAFAEVYLALQQGVVDAQENPLPTIQFKKFYEVQSNINLTGHITNSLATVVSPVTMNKMGEDGAALLEALATVATQTSDEIVASEGELADWFRDQGVTVNEVDRKPFMEAVAPHLTGEDVPWDAAIFERLQAIQE